MANSTPFIGPANWREPCYYYPGIDVPRPVHSMYDNLTMNFSEIPCMYISLLWDLPRVPREQTEDFTSRAMPQLNSPKPFIDQS